MKTNTIITIGRQYGSGGKEIGHFVAEAFGIKLYDKEMLARAAKESGICEELFETHDEKPTNSFLYSLVMDTYSMGYAGNTYTEMPINHKVFLAQFDAIKKIADEGPCVLVGRCADYALESYPNVVSIFIRADMEDRIRRVATRLDLTDAKAKDLINKTDKKRASYYNYYTNKKWGEAASYELCLNSSELGVQGTAKAIEQYILLKESIEKEAKKKQKTVEIKEVRLSPNIDTNDLNTKVNNAKKFISKGNKVKVTLRFRGREMAHVQQSKHILDDFAKQLEDVATVEKAAKLEGRNMSMVLAEKR